VLSCKGVEVAQNGHPDSLRHANLFPRPLYSNIGCYFADSFPIRSADGHSKSVDGCSVNENFFEEACLQVNSFYFVRSHVLALLKFEDVLYSVNYLQAEVGNYHAYVSCLNPAFRIDGFACQIISFVVPLEYLRPSCPNLTSWSGSSLSISIIGCVFQFRKIT
jgi:hypothetical protein